MFKLLRKLPQIDEVKNRYPVDKRIKDKRDRVVSDILLGKDNRLLLIVGPCSMDSEYGIYSYLDKLMILNEKINKVFYVVPRLYTSKPRSLSGFRGLIHSPDMLFGRVENGFIDTKSQNISEGIWLCRKILSKILTGYSLTGADELLYPELFWYFDDLISYAAVGTRSTENQQHRMFASGLNIAVGFKNPLSGNVNSLINSVFVAKNPNNLSINGAEYQTSGNQLAHAVFRGYTGTTGDSVFNAGLDYFLNFFNLQKEKLSAQNKNQKDLQFIPFLVDASHDNSQKNYLKQADVLNQIAKNLQNCEYKKLFKGIMLESYLHEGKNEAGGDMILGRSQTDGCLGFEQTEKILLNFLEKIG